MATLPPGVIRTRSGDTSTPSRRFKSSDTASRNGAIPVASV